MILDLVTDSETENNVGRYPNIMKQWFSNVGISTSDCLRLKDMDLPEIEEISYSSSVNSDSLISSVLLLFMYILLPARRFIFESKFPDIPFDAINTKKKLDSYISEIIESGSTCIRKVRLFTIGHQGSGKTSLIHSVR